MKTNFFDCLLVPADPAAPDEYTADLLLGEARTGAKVRKYDTAPENGEFACVTLGPEIDIKWNDGFGLVGNDGVRREGRCLWPGALDDRAFSPAKRDALLGLLAGDVTGMLQALTEIEGMRGVDETALAGFCGLSGQPVEEAAVRLEGDGKILILSFEPLFLVARSALEFLKERTAGFLRLYHEKHPDRTGAELERIAKRFPSHPKVLQLALKSLEKEARIVPEDGLYRMSDFKAVPSAEDMELLAKLEKYFQEGEIVSGRYEEIQASLNVSPWKLQSLIATLVERSRILQTGEGYYVHSDWLQKLIENLRASGRKEISISEFKDMTGFSRKFAIPLLELLDRMGVTRRKGSVREIQPER